EKDPFRRENIKKIIEGTVAICGAKFKFAEVPLSVNGFRTDLAIECREAEISQVMVNLLSNAFDAIEQLDEKWVNVELKTIDNDWVEISVEDSGNQIPPDLRAKILDPFFTTKEPGKGTGLGLSISKNIVEEHGGFLILDEESPHTRFIIRLPV